MQLLTRIIFLALAIGLIACRTQDPTIPARAYTPERDAEILARFSSLKGSQKLCADEFIRDYQKSLFDYCEATGSGENVGGGCSHVAYAWSLHTRVFELGLEECASAVRARSMRPNNSFKPKPLRGSA
jgi:hypothetical protein